MANPDEVREKLYRKEFFPNDVESRRFLAFDPSLRYLKDFQGDVIRNAGKGEDPIALQMRYTFFQDLEPENARKRFIMAINYGSMRINEFFSQFFGDLVRPFDFHQVDENANLTALLREAQINYQEAIISGGHEMTRTDGSLKPLITIKQTERRFYNYKLLSDAFRAVRSVGIGYNILKIVQSSEFVLHELHHNGLVDWTKNCFGVCPSSEFYHRKKSEISVLSKMVCKGYNMGTIKDLTGVRFVLQNRAEVGDFLRSAKSKVRGASGVESFERTRERKVEDSRFYDPRFDCDKFVLRPSIPYAFGQIFFSNSPELESILGATRIRLPVEVQVMTQEALKRMNAGTEQAPAHKLYKYKKALAFWQIVNPWKIFGPLMAQDEGFLSR